MSFNLTDRYMLYKEGTSRITRWLVTTATACRRSATAKTKDGFVSTKDLRRYTQLIVSWKPPIEVPGSVTELIEDVIIGRRDCADFYAAQDAADAGHEAFISALEEIWSKLKEARSTRKKGKGASRGGVEESREGPPSLKRKEAALDNLFENLQVEDPSEEFTDSAPSRKYSKHTQTPQAEPTLDVYPDEERRFALFCFLKDMFEVRKVIEGTWEEAVDQKLSYGTAAMVARTGLGFMERAHVTLVAEHPSLGSETAITRLLGAEIKIDDVTHRPFLVKLGTSEEMTGECVDFLCPYGATLTRHILYEWDQISNEVLAKSDGVGGYPTYQLAGQADENFAFHPFAKLMHSLLPQIAEIVLQEHKDVNGCYGPLFLPRILKAFTPGTETIHIMYLSQMFEVYMSIHSVMENVNTDTCRLYAAYARRTKLVIDKYCEFSIGYIGSLVDDFLGPKALQWVEEAFDLASVLDGEPRASNEKAPPGPVGNKLIKLWRSIPALAAEQINLYQMRLCPKGLIAANEGFVVIAMGYLYRAVQHTGTLDVVWPDMDWLLPHHGSERSLVEDVRPGQSVGVFLRRFYIALGAPATMFADPKTSSRIKEDNIRYKESRTFGTTSTYFRVASQVINADKALGVCRGNWTEVALQKILAERVAKERRSHSRRKAEGEKELSFDYFSFWLDIAELFVKIRVETDGMLQGRDIKFMPNAYLAAPIFVEALDIEETKHCLRTSPLDAVGRILREHIATKGALYTAAADDFIAGRIPQSWINGEVATKTCDESDDFELPQGDWNFEEGLVQGTADLPARVERSADASVYQPSVEDVVEVEDQAASDGPDGWPVSQLMG